MNRDYEEDMRKEDCRYARIQVACLVLMLLAMASPLWVPVIRTLTK